MQLQHLENSKPQRQEERKAFIWLIFILLNMLITSCTLTQEVEIPPIEIRLAVSGLAEYGDISFDPRRGERTDIFVSRISSYGELIQDSLRQGLVVFSGPSGSDTLTPSPFQSQNFYAYQIDRDWIPGSSYDLQVSFPDLPEASCTFEVPKKHGKAELWIEDSIVVNDELKHRFSIRLRDPDPNKLNYFRIDLFALWTDPTSGESVMNNIGWIQEAPLLSSKSGYFSDQHFINGQLTISQELDLSYLPFPPSFWQNWIFEVRSIEAESFDFLEELEIHTSARANNLFGLPKPLRGNIEGGEGFFGVVAVSKDTIAWPD
ncbi:MAG: DUF4249 family protein [Bacteroidota bacterium]